MSEQLPLDLPLRPALGRDAFLVGPSNARALAMIEGWRDWPAGKLALVGPEGSGKTHLACVWAEASGATLCDARDLPMPETLPERTCLAVEDLDRALPLAETAERRLFHLHNRVLEGGGRLLFTGRRAPTAWAVALPDLRSRLEATAAVTLEPPDDRLLEGVLVKLFADRQVRVEAQVIAFLVNRIGRTLGEAARVVDVLDRAALAEGAELRVPLARRVLADMDTP